MNRARGSPEEPLPSKKACAQAAAWIAKLHDEQRGSDLEARIRAWLAKSEDHRRAFSRLTSVWERTGEIRMRARGDTSAMRTGLRWRFNPWAVTLAATLVLAVSAFVYYRRESAIVTGIGQRQVRLLPDGTRVVLNTETRIEVTYDEQARRVRLVHGEARFDVSKRPAWPFLVSAGSQEIHALGTSFIVRHDDAHDFSVILVEGRIIVAPIARSANAATRDRRLLAPGQRLTISRNTGPIVDQPELTRITAWEQGRVEFEDTPLGEAASEMNRYSKGHVSVTDADTARLRIGGVFRSGDSDEFVRIITVSLGLRADHVGDDVVLSRPAASATSSVP
jgi:transmembrane sensor